MAAGRKLARFSIFFTRYRPSCVENGQTMFLSNRFFGRISIVVAFLTVACMRAGAETVPLPRQRPAAVGDQLSTSSANAEPSPCQLRLAQIAEFKPARPITGPGECSATDVVTLEVAFLLDRQRVVFSPAVILRCTMAEAVTQWVRNDVAPALVELVAPLRAVETLDFL
jgi:hypothetical protein